MSDLFERSGTFTRNAWEWLYQTVDHSQFESRDAELIYQSLERDFQPVHFGRYLQHYIFKKAGMAGSYTDIPLKDYQTIIQDAFRDTGTPGSFQPASSKLSALAKNWLTQHSVKRHALLLMGFGLKMSREEVNEFLYKVLHEPLLNSQNPMEAVCAYCYQHGYGYYKFQSLMKLYEQLDPLQPDFSLVQAAQPAGRPESLSVIQEDTQLLRSLIPLKKNSGGQADDTAYRRFLSLYDRARDLVAAQYNRAQAEDDRLLAGRLREQLDQSDRLYDYQKQERVRRAETRHAALTRDDISESDLERILCSAIPLDAHGNLVPAKRSTLNALFDGSRFGRQHISDILLKKAEPERFDLITLNFLIISLEEKPDESIRKRYARFIESTNSLLLDCFMGPLYVANPYECFVLMCMLSLSPLETYTEVIEKSYQSE